MSKSDALTPISPGGAPDCAAARDLIPAYALGLTDPAEAALVEAALPVCPGLADELVAYRRLAAPLAASVPQVEPPPALFARLMAEAAVTRPSAPRAPDAASSPAAPIAFPPMPARQPDPKRPVARLLLIAAAVAALVILAALNLALLARGLATQAQLTERLEAQTAMLALFAQDEVLRFELRDPQDAQRAWRGQVLCHPDATVAVLRAENLPASGASDTAYQVWLWADGQRTDGGLLRVGADGRGTLVLQAPQPMRHYEYIGVAAVEGDGPSLLRGALYADDAP